MQNEVFYWSHEHPSAGHFGCNATNLRACQKFYWPGMNEFLKRKVRNVLTSNEPGQLPMVQKAKPNPEEYHQFSRSQKTSRSSSFSESVCLSDESLSSPEQQTIAKRPDSEAVRPALATLFSPGREEEVQVMTAVLPDGSKMTASSGRKIFTIGDKTDQQ